MAAAQQGNAARWQLRAAGLGDGVIDRLIRRGHLLRVHRAVFAVAGLPEPVPLAAEIAALLSLRDGSLLGHRTAAGLWGITPRHGGLVHVLVNGSSAGRRRGVRIHRTVTIEDSDRSTMNGLPITSPVRTLFDIVPVLEPRQRERALDQGLVRGLLRLPELERRLERGGDRRALKVMRELLADHAGPTITRSHAEELFLTLIRQADLPQPQVNVRRLGYELDFLWERERVVVEIDGYAFHHTHRAFERDHRRDGALRAAGFSPWRFTWRQLTREPMVVIARVAAALASAG